MSMKTIFEQVIAREHAHPQYDYDAEIEAIWAAIRALR